MKHILFLTNKNRQYRYIQELASTVFSDESKGPVKVEAFKIKDDILFDTTWISRLTKADCVILTHTGMGLESPFLHRLGKWLYANHQCYVLLIEEKSKNGLIKGVSDEAILTIEKYLGYGGRDNLISLIHYLGSLSGDKEVQVKPPQEIPWYGIVGRHGEIYSTYEEYKKFYSFTGKGTVGILFYRDEWIAGELFYQNELFDAVREANLEPVLFFSQYGANPITGQTSLKYSLDALFGIDNLPFDALLNTCKFSIIGLKGLTEQELATYDIPIFQSYVMYVDETTWKNNEGGLTPAEVSMSVALPEMDGVLHGGVVASQELSNGEFIYKPVEERILSVIKRIKNWVKLRYLRNSDKRVAIIFHNYPPTNSNIGSAAGLDSPESVCRLLSVMKEEGYIIENVPKDSSELMNQILIHTTNERRFLSDEHINEADSLSDEAYIHYFQTKSDSFQQHVTKDWGNPPGEVFHYKDRLIIPGFSNGNVWITVQPPRGFGENPSKLYHDPLCAPPHHYEAFYHWLRTEWKANAVIHVGTHGSLEWLPGKGTGLSADCYPESAIGDLPNIYPYWTTIVGEGIQAKRRSAACLIGHLTPPMTQAGLYDVYEELERVLDEYNDYVNQGDSQKANQAFNIIIEKAKKCHLYEEVVDDEQSVPNIVVAELHTRLTDLKYTQMRCGLHILSNPPTGISLRNFICSLVQTPNGDVPSLPAIWAECLGYDYENLRNHGSEVVSEGSFNGQLKSKVQNYCCEKTNQLLDALAKKQFVMPLKGSSFPELEELLSLADEMQCKKIMKVLHIVCNDYLNKLSQTVDEIPAIMHALAGGYVKAGPGGALTGGRVDVLPTGRNFYGIDERTLPTQTAYKVGGQLANQVIEAYIESEGRYPEQVGIILWAGNNTRSYGQCAGQFLNLLGVRPKWQHGSGRVVGLEIIPLEELKRPRIDVTARISGLLRDMMPNLVEWLDKAVLLVSELDESPEDNYVKKHVAEDVDWLLSEGESEFDAYVKARWRIFGDPIGAYGTGIGGVLEGKNWNTIDDLAEVYVTWGSYSYSTDREVPHDVRLFKRRLATMDVTIKNEDNCEVSLFSADDYNSYHGGMIAAVRSFSGKHPMSFVGDSSDSSHIVVRDLQTEIKRQFRSEAANPKFIEGMMRHGYKGASDMSNYVAHSYQWDATSLVIEDWMYETYAEKYTLDSRVQQWMRQVNPWALHRITETLLEAIQRGLWQTSEKMQNDLRSLYISLEGTLEEDSER